MKAPRILILKRKEIAALLSLEDCIRAVKNAFRLHAEGKTLAPGLLHIDSREGEFHIKAGGLELEQTYFALKANGGFFQNMARYGLPNIQGVILLFDGDKGSPLAVMDSMEITIQRTGAATAVAADYLARKDSRVATVCGCGNQGRVQLRALKQVLPDINQVFAIDAVRDVAERYASEMSGELGIPVTALETLESAAKKSDVIVTCTPARQFFLRQDHVKSGTFVAAVGADSPDKQELDPKLMVGAKVVVDILDQCAAVGELHHALAAGLVTLENVHGELGQLVAGQIPGRTSDQEITIFDATGTALQDAAAAVVAYQRAVQENTSLKLDLFE